MRRLARLQEIQAGVGGHGPVVVLAAAVDAGEGLLMQQAVHAVAIGHLLHDLHGQLVLVGGDVGGAENGGQLMLGRGHLVVLGFGQDAQLPQLLVQLLHESGNTGAEGAEIVIVQLLPLGGTGAEQSAAGIEQILALIVHLAVDEKIFLLRAHGSLDIGDLGVAEQAEDAHGLPVDSLHRAEEGGLFIQRLTAERAEGGGDAQGAVLDKGVGGGVPGGIAPGLEGGPQAAGGEAGGVRLADNQLLAGEFHDDMAVVGGGDEAVMLLGGDAGHGLEPMRIVGGALF